MGIPCIYGLPKIYEPDIPLRPIVSFLTSLTYKLSKHLANKLGPLVGNSSPVVKNSTEFAEYVATQKLQQGECLVSFDVVSLFARVPIDLAISVTKHRLEMDETLEEHTILSSSSILNVLKMCLEATYFVYRGDNYQQVFGTAMGSPVSVTVANLIMEDVEERALATFHTPPRFWKKNVDDVCVAMKWNHISQFLNHLNAIEQSIEFKAEMEYDDNTLPYMDICLYHTMEGTIHTSV